MEEKITLRELRERNLYRHEMTDEQHAALLQVLKKSKAKIILSSYDNELYNEELRGWATSEHTAIAQQGKNPRIVRGFSYTKRANGDSLVRGQTLSLKLSPLPYCLIPIKGISPPAPRSRRSDPRGSRREMQKRPF